MIQRQTSSLKRQLRVQPRPALCMAPLRRGELGARRALASSQQPNSSGSVMLPRSMRSPSLLRPPSSFPHGVGASASGFSEASRRRLLAQGNVRNVSCLRINKPYAKANYNNNISLFGPSTRQTNVLLNFVRAIQMQHIGALRNFCREKGPSKKKQDIPMGWEHFPDPHATDLKEHKLRNPPQTPETPSSKEGKTPSDSPSQELPKEGENEPKPKEEPRKRRAARERTEEDIIKMMEDHKKKKSPNPDDDEKNSNMFTTAGPVVSLATLTVLMIGSFKMANHRSTISWDLFKQAIKDKTIHNISIHDKESESLAYLSKSGGGTERLHIGTSNGFERRLEQLQLDFGIPEADFIPVSYYQQPLWMTLLGIAFPLVIATIAIYWARNATGFFTDRKGFNPFEAQKSKAKLWNQYNKVTTTFDDVAGLSEVKVEVQEFVDFLKNPKKYHALGAKIPKGALLVGPPGTGKTLLAKAMAGEAGTPFFSTSGSDFVEMFVGVGPARVRDMFKQARKLAPCIIFIDEIDAVGRSRSNSGMGNANDERENTLNQILVEMDGFTPSTGIVVLAGTNRPDVLDAALTRPGRFDRQIALDNPDIKSRVEIFMVHMKPLKLKQDLDRLQLAERLAKLTPGFSGADIANTCNEAALICARFNEEAIELRHFEYAIDRVVGGVEKKTKLLSPTEKKTVAYHEAGHATVSWFLEHADPLLKVTIVPRGRAALGYAQYLPEERFLHTQNQMNDMMVMALGGRVAEELIFGTFTTGARDDLDKVTRIAYSQVQTYGMNPEIGSLSFKEKESSIKKFSDYTAEIMDNEVRKLITTAYERCRSILMEQREGLEQVAQLLLEKEVLNGDDLEKIFGIKRKGETVKVKPEFVYEKKKDELIFPENE